MALLLAACAFRPSPRFPRAALPLPPEVASRFELPATPELIDSQHSKDGRVMHGRLRCGEEEVHFHHYAGHDETNPLVVLIPILGGGRELMEVLALEMVGRGYQAVWCERAEGVLRAPQRGPDLERLFQRMVVHQRAVLHWLLTRPGPRPAASFAMGVSLGGIIAVALTAVEENIAGAAICLAGANLPTVVIDSAEPRIDSWRRWRRDEDRIDARGLESELRDTLLSDPAHLAAHIETDRTFLVAAGMDDVIRPQHQDLLWEALGRPERLTVGLGHYSAALALGPILTAVSGYFSARLPATRPNTAD